MLFNFVALVDNQFNDANTARKTVYHHVTCATDSENIKVVFNSCKDTVLRSNFRYDEQKDTYLKKKKGW